MSSGSAEDRLYHRLPVLRTERELSRRDLADAVGVHYQTIGYLERGEYSPSLALAFRIARFFELPIEAVFSDQPFELMSRSLHQAPPARPSAVPGATAAARRRPPTTPGRPPA
ncbi:MAG: helix-turn-helix transcriptional regulator [Nitriliruptoraceae bacterium]|nr:helix-turn-helix transcriptional regulator [Nitriliruptoraceae bacterium]